MRGSVVLVEGGRYQVIAVRRGLAWLAGGPWRTFAIAPVHACVVVRNVFAANTPWEVN